MEKLNAFLEKSYTAFHAVQNAKALLDEQGFTALSETEDWALGEGGKYYVTRDGAVIAFTVGSLCDFSYKIVASHTDSPALKLKENPVQKSAFYATLNVETYGGGLWYSFFDKPLKIAGRVVRREGNRLFTENVLSPFTLTIPSVAIHQNREANEKLALNPQVDLQALLGMADGHDVCVAGEDLGGICHALTLGCGGRAGFAEAQHRAAQLQHSGLEAQSGAGRGLIKEGGQFLMCALVPVVLGMGDDVLGGGDELIQLFHTQVQNADHTSHITMLRSQPDSS